MRSEEADRARKPEIKNLVRIDTEDLVLEESALPGSNIIYGSFLIAIKNLKPYKQTFKTRFVAHSHYVAGQYNLVHDSKYDY